MPKPYTHLLEVEMRVQIPVQDFAADANGLALDWTKVNKNTWRVKTLGFAG
jgi:hypothetical protein